jgi:hypothetical protein
MIEIANDVGGGRGVAVDADGAGTFVDSAADVEDSWQGSG